MHLHILDVGQGDAILLQTVDKKYVLIDGGPTNNLIDVMADFMPFWQKHIDLVIATHGDSDHIGGLVELADRYEIDKFMYNGESKDTLIYKELLQNMTSKKVDMFVASAGQAIMLGCCSEINILWPDRTQVEDSNDRSVSIIFKYDNFEAYLAGDLSSKYEEIITNDLTSEIEVMKLSHHGSRTSTSTKVLNNISPDVALISSGKDNKFGHPHKEVVNLLNKNNIVQFRTDLYGTVSIESDGTRYNIKTDKGNK
jgi:competence protein ComEC